MKASRRIARNRQPAVRTGTFVHHGKVALALIVFLLLGSSTAGAVQWTRNEIDELVEKVDDVVAALENAKTMTTELAGSGLKNRLIDQLEQAKDLLDQQEEGFDDFTDGNGKCEGSSECRLFRDQLTEFFFNFELLANELLSFQDNAQLGVQMSFQRLRDIMDKLPPLTLYPIYLATNVEASIFGGDFPQALGDLAMDLQTLSEGFDTSCDAINADPERYRKSAKAVLVVGGGMTALGKLLIAKGKTGISGKPVKIHGYAGVLIQTDFVGKLGTALAGFGQAVMPLSDFLNVKLRHCAVILGQETLMAEHQQILTNQSTLLARQLEVIRLLHTPAGRRSSSVPACNGGPCTFPER